VTWRLGTLPCFALRAGGFDKAKRKANAKIGKRDAIVPHTPKGRLAVEREHAGALSACGLAKLCMAESRSSADDAHALAATGVFWRASSGG
jgi:hypothetical protein